MSETGCLHPFFRAPSGERPVNDYGLFLCHLAYRVRDTLASVAALLETAKRHITRTERTGAVNDNAPDFQLVSDIQRIVYIFRKDAGLKAIGRIVGDPDGVRGVFERIHRRNWAKHFLPHTGMSGVTSVRMVGL